MVQFHGLNVSRGHYFATTMGQHICASPRKLIQSQIATPSTHQKCTFCTRCYCQIGKQYQIGSGLCKLPTDSETCAQHTSEYFVIVSPLLMQH